MLPNVRGLYRVGTAARACVASTPSLRQMLLDLREEPRTLNNMTALLPLFRLLHSAYRFPPTTRESAHGYRRIRRYIGWGWAQCAGGRHFPITVIGSSRHKLESKMNRPQADYADGNNQGGAFLPQPPPCSHRGLRFTADDLTNCTTRGQFAVARTT
jgi:hypothetical protein